MSEKVSGSTDKIDKIITIGGKEDEIRNLADALAADYQISAAPNVLDAAKRLVSKYYGTMHHWLGIAIQDCYRNYDNVDYLLERMEKFETMVKEDLP